MAKKEFDFVGFRHALGKAAFAKGEWAGCPISVADQKMVIAPGYPFAHIFERTKDEAQPEVVNQWFCSKLRTTVGILRDAEGKMHAGIVGANNTAGAVLDTLRATVCWDIEAEIKAVEKLEGLISDHLFNMYMLTGMFIETSKRSNVSYIFRRLRPTLALSLSALKYCWRRGEMEESSVRILCALCLHPIGYYEGSWAGAMVPTDDVLAHLLLMRADEPYFWKKSNQIPAYLPQAGIF